MLEQAHDASGSAGARRGAARHQMPDVDRMETVGVLARVDRFEHPARIDVQRQRHLHQNSVDIVAGVELVDEREQFFGRDRFRRRQFFTENSQLCAGFDLVADVDFGAGVVADQNYGESGRTGEATDARSQLRQDLRPHLGAFENLRHFLWPSLSDGANCEQAGMRRRELVNTSGTCRIAVCCVSFYR